MLGALAAILNLDMKWQLCAAQRAQRRLADSSGVRKADETSLPQFSIKRLSL